MRICMCSSAGIGNVFVQLMQLTYTVLLQMQILAHEMHKPQTQQQVNIIPDAPVNCQGRLGRQA